MNAKHSFRADGISLAPEVDGDSRFAKKSTMEARLAVAPNFVS